MTYPVRVLLPEGVEWPPLEGVEVLARDSPSGDVSEVHPFAASEVHLLVRASDEQLELLLIAVAQRAAQLGGVAVDGRSGKRLEGVNPVDPGPDGGPVWEHLPGVGLAAPLSDFTVDIDSALRRSQSLEHAGEPVRSDYPMGLALDLASNHSLGVVLGLVVSTAATSGALATWGVEAGPWISPVAPLALILAVSRPKRSTVARALVLLVSVCGVAAIVAVGAHLGGRWLVTSVLAGFLPLLYCLPTAAWVGDSPVASVRVALRKLREHPIQIPLAWLFLNVVILVLLAIPTWLLWEQSRDPALLALVAVPGSGLAFLYPIAIGVLAGRD